MMRRLACLVSALMIVVLAACGPTLKHGWRDQPRRALQARVTVVTAADGRLRPVLEAEVPRRALVFRQEPDGRFSARVEVSVTAVRADQQAGGGVGAAEVLVDALVATRSDDLVTARVPLTLRGREPVELRVVASQAGTVRRWQRQLAFDPEPLAAAPLIPTSVDVAPESRELLAETDSIRVLMTAWRPDGADARTADGLRLEAVLTGPDGSERALSPYPLASSPAIGDTLQTAIAWPAEDLPFGELRLTLALSWTRDGTPWRLPDDRTLAVTNLTVTLEDDDAWGRQVAWLQGLLDDEDREALEDTSAPERRAAWATVWGQLAQDQPHAGRDLERAHLLRIVEADRRFTGHGRGAETDRGRALIRHGEPDRVEQRTDTRVPGAVWEVWTYRAAGLRLLFHDVHGLGDFRLRRQEPLPPGGS